MDKLNKLLAAYVNLNFPVKFVIIALAGSLGGSTYIAFLSEYATYYYAWDAGFRVPAEGSPYLKATINAISFMAILLSFLVFLFVYLFGQFIWQMVEYHIWLNKSIDLCLDYLYVKKFEKFEKFKWKLVAVFSTSLGVLTGVITGLVIYYYAEKNMDPVLFGSISGGAIFILILMIYRRKILIYVSSIIALVFSIASPIILFNTEVYGGLIKELGYGGELPITLILPNENTKTHSILFLRTNTSLFISSDNDSIVEYPVSEVKYIEYKK